jgi:hypothetical protein
MEEMLLPILLLHKLVLGLGGGGRGTDCVYCMLGERSKHIKSFSLEIPGRKSSVGRKYLLKWTSEIKVVMILYRMACVMALYVLAEKNFRVADCSVLLKYTLRSRVAIHVITIRDWRTALFCHNTVAKHFYFDLPGKCRRMM